MRFLFITTFILSFLMSIDHAFANITSPLAPTDDLEVNTGNSDNVTGKNTEIKTTFGEIVNNVMNPDMMGDIKGIFIAGFALVGIILVAMGLVNLAEYTDKQQSASLRLGIAKIFGGSTLVALPIAVTTIHQTLFKSKDDYTIKQGSAASKDQLQSADTIAELYTNFVQNAADPLTKASLMFAILLGTYLVGSGLLRLIYSSNPSSPHSGKVTNHITRIVIGVLFINLSGLVEVLSNVFFASENKDKKMTADVLRGSGDKSILTYNKNAGEGESVLTQVCGIESMMYTGLIPFGIIAFITGLRTIYLSLDQGQQATMAGGITKIVAGILLVNMELFATAVINTISPSAAALGSICG